MGDWLDGLIGAGDQIGADIIGFMNYLIGLLVALFSYLWDLIVSAVLFLYHLLLSVGQFFHTLWDDFFKGIFQNLWSALLKVHAWLESILSPIVKFIQQVRAYFDWFFNTYVKPFLNILSQIRNFLNILRQFGIKWAATLDAFLGKVQADISGAMLKIQGYLNSLIGIVQSLSDPLGLFRRPTFVMSMRRIFPSFMRGVSGLPLGYFFPSPRKNAGAGLNAPPFPFNPTDPNQNPQPSGYLGGDDGLGSFGGWDGVDPLADDSMDLMTGLDYFNDDAYPDPVCTDPVACLAQLQQNAANAITGANS
jgi:hypothetical protein